MARLISPARPSSTSRGARSPWSRLGSSGPDSANMTEGKSPPIFGHHVPMVMFGTFLLAFGWFGFNPGSTLSGTNDRIGQVAVNTSRLRRRHPVRHLFHVEILREARPLDDGQWHARRARRHHRSLAFISPPRSSSAPSPACSSSGASYTWNAKASTTPSEPSASTASAASGGSSPSVSSPTEPTVKATTARRKH